MQVSKSFEINSAILLSMYVWQSIHLIILPICLILLCADTCMLLVQPIQDNLSKRKGVDTAESTDSEKLPLIAHYLYIQVSTRRVKHEMEM